MAEPFHHFGYHDCIKNFVIDSIGTSRQPASCGLSARLPLIFQAHFLFSPCAAARYETESRG